MARRQLLELGYSTKAIERRIEKGRLHRIWRGVFAVGRPALTVHGRWMAAVLSCGSNAVLSHYSAAALWGIRSPALDRIHISVTDRSPRRPPGIVVHRRTALTTEDVTRHLLIPVTAPVSTLVDIATQLDHHHLEAAINEADKLDLIDPEQLRSALDEVPARPGKRALREVLDRPTFTLTDSELERSFLPIIKKAGLPAPLTGHRVNGFKVDFFWPDLGLVVETDGLRYHRTPAQQTRDRLRDQLHAVSGLTSLRFTRAQVKFEPRYVETTLAAMARRLRERGG